MRFRLALAALFVAPELLCSQTIVDNGIDDRIEALNAVFAFRSDLSREGTVIARCPIPLAAGDTGTIPGLEPRFQALLVLPDTAQTRGFRGCAVHGFADPKRHVLWLESLIEITKSARSGFIPPFRARQFDITFQYLAGPGYREFHRYVVEPSGISPTKDRNQAQISGWRVVEYRLVGWDFHWGDNLGHGSGVRLP